MPKTKDAISRYQIIDSELRKWRPLKTSELAKKCTDNLGGPISIRTIQKDISDLKDDSALGYNAQIKYSSKLKAYYYDKNAPEIFPSVKLTEEEINALLFYSKALSHYKSYSIFTEISQAIEKVLNNTNIPGQLREAIKSLPIFEAEKSLPIKGNELIKEIIVALINCKKIEFDYARFNDTPKRRKLIPYILKEDKQMWYIVGQIDGKGFPTTFALDRICNLKIMDEAFIPSGFNSDEYFKYSFGITVSDEDPIEIILSFNPIQGNYIKTLPIHETQKIISDNEEEVRISLSVKPSYEFYSKIMSYGSSVQIISPLSEAKKIKGFLTEALKSYKK